MEQFVVETHPEVWRICAALVDAATADDLTQETFLRAARALPQFRGDSSARTWVMAIARRVCMDELRRRYRQGQRDHRLEPAGEEVESVPDIAGDIAVKELLLHLGPERRAAFVLTQLFRLSYEEAAVVCDCPPGTIRSRVARAREDLIELVADRRAPNDAKQQ
jgi:RNA polymerase sigma-70 factor, ECF subfamily